MRDFLITPANTPGDPCRGSNLKVTLVVDFSNTVTPFIKQKPERFNKNNDLLAEKRVEIDVIRY